MSYSYPGSWGLAVAQRQRAANPEAEIGEDAYEQFSQRVAQEEYYTPAILAYAHNTGHPVHAYAHNMGHPVQAYAHNTGHPVQAFPAPEPIYHPQGWPGQGYMNTYPGVLPSWATPINPVIYDEDETISAPPSAQAINKRSQTETEENYMPHVEDLNIDPEFSDAVNTVPVPFGDRCRRATEQQRQRYVRNLTKLWRENRANEDPGREIDIPSGYNYVYITRNTPSVKVSIDLFLFGHPSQYRFRSVNEFYPHFEHLIRKWKGEQNLPPCPCNGCAKLAKGGKKAVQTRRRRI
jgi:hypothetical protein